MSAKNNIIIIKTLRSHCFPLHAFRSLFFLAFTSGSQKYCIQEEALNLYAYVILENHFHLIASAMNLSETISSFE